MSCEEDDTQGKYQMTTEVEIGVMHLKAIQHQQPPEEERKG
jgi:hypothetical protein